MDKRHSQRLTTTPFMRRVFLVLLQVCIVLPFSHAQAEESKRTAASIEASNKVLANIFGIELMGNDQSDPLIVDAVKDILTNTLDRNKDGLPDNPELAEFTAQARFKALILSRPDAIKLDRNDSYVHEDNMVWVFNDFLSMDSYLISAQGILDGSYTSYLRFKKANGDAVAEAELNDLALALGEIHDSALRLKAGDDFVEDTQDTSDDTEKVIDRHFYYIFFAQLASAGYIPKILERRIESFQKTIEAASELTGKEYSYNLSSTLTPWFHQWKDVSKETLRLHAPRLIDWLDRHHLQLPDIDLNRIPVIAEDMTKRELKRLEEVSSSYEVISQPE
ncbi:hypothetical protein [Parendozoicomonas haliclonae]|uniref:Uncharacterized protein n=1 Tax=Parendozoicomonas haliclonae TaxID=1960125 RepID=A0A1X7AFN9_9GAMM|nr:hypothetical protein [Parendozoicomonas haliclonae]SMA38119.1 hypothetical protein EHSB41UT_00832 [Parendozoicomonas haliclonae]